MLLISAMFCFTFSQTNIPVPIEFLDFDINSVTNIGDFDGDGSEDMVVKFAGYNIYAISIYSFKKNQHLLKVGPSQNTTFPLSTFGDFNGDKLNEVVIDGIIYEYSNTLAKKKIDYSPEN